jgi:hypothetical protein
LACEPTLRLPVFVRVFVLIVSAEHFVVFVFVLTEFGGEVFDAAG